MAARVRDAVRWVVVAVLAVLALLSTRSTSAPVRREVVVVPAPAAVQAAAVPGPRGGDALATVADGNATCEARAAAGLVR